MQGLGCMVKGVHLARVKRRVRHAHYFTSETHTHSRTLSFTHTQSLPHYLSHTLTHSLTLFHTHSLTHSLSFTHTASLTHLARAKRRVRHADNLVRWQRKLEPCGPPGDSYLTERVNSIVLGSQLPLKIVNLVLAITN